MTRYSISQINQELIQRHPSLDNTDLGKWVWLNNGCLELFSDSQEQLSQRLKDCFGKNINISVI